MSLDQNFRDCAVLGAAGKMGRGITLLVLQEMARLEALSQGKMRSGLFRLVLVDQDSSAFPSLIEYLREQLSKYAEKLIIPLRTAFNQNAALVSNADMVNEFVNGALDNVSTGTRLEEAIHAKLVFEALPEEIVLKVQTLQKLAQLAPELQYYFSNTSSIPINILEQQANLQNRIVGLHFYNPPPVQKLMEISFPDKVTEDTKQFALEIAKRFNKTIVITKDFPGFIGNNYFMRELAFANSITEKLAGLLPAPAAIFAVDMISKDYLLHPMGIFQLADYVGIGICYHIAQTISSLVGTTDVISPLISTLFEKNILGGVTPEGYQKDGIFKYNNKGLISAVYDTTTSSYINIQDPMILRAVQLLGSLPEGHQPWKVLIKKNSPQEFLRSYFEKIVASEAVGSKLALEYLKACRLNAELLVNSEIASSPEDINTVVKLGFHQVYGPMESFLDSLLVTKVET
ncbi:MAG: 3-hydroxyacyl-CoA dehydrogenase family protein [Parachlamydiales bacterium]|jgi:3-hydroxyacyl-CoA dehydrogenase